MNATTDAITHDDQYLLALMHKHALPDAYQHAVDQVIAPLAARIAAWQATLGKPLLIALNGAQGTGKTTLADFVQALLLQQHQRRCVVLSLDDLYLTQAQRNELARNVHPLLRTRGVPGTHDLLLGNQILDGLLTEPADTVIGLPKFNKANDDRAPSLHWPQVMAQPDIVIVEGWCMGARPISNTALLEKPINALERNEDPQGVWRRYVNRCLRFEYTAFFQRFDRLIVLKAPSFACVKQWRTLQEQKLTARLQSAPNKCSPSLTTSGLMNEPALQRFLMHYERLTLAMLDDLPSRADAVVAVDEQHTLMPIQWRQEEHP